MTAVLPHPVSVDLLTWPSVVIGIGSDGKIVASNGRLETLIGAPVLGKQISDVLDAESSGRKWERIAAMRVHDATQRWELIFHGTDRLLEPRTFTAVAGSGAAAIWLVEHPMDTRLDAMAGRMEAMNAELVTAQRALFKEQARLAAALKELERSNAALDEFAHVASHDLKAPLRAIADYTELLEEEVGALLPDESRGHLTRVGVLAQKMRRMVDAVLDYARAGRASTAFETVDAADVIRDQVEFLAPPKNVTVVVDDDLPTFEAARVPFEQVFRNLIGNAIKYGRAEGAEIRVSAGRANDCWHFVVADNGPGVADAQQERIWRLFQTTRPSEGAGIGLALVKRIVEAQGGRVYIESSPGHGARFHVLWPKHPRPSARAES
jgi:signal transduction histidine kinase